MRKVSETPNVDINSAYPDGGIRDRVGGTPGTPLRETLYHDWLQLGHKLMRDAGLVYNDLPDNETNGYQALQALQTEMDKRYRTAFQIATAAEWNAVGNNFNGILTPGDYLIIDTGGKANLPFAGFEGGLRVHARGTSYVQQEATDRFTQRTLVRTFSDGVWSGWSEGEVTDIEYRNASGTESIKKMRTKVIEIGAWDMDAASGVNLQSGLTSGQLEKSIIDGVTILRDNGSRSNLKDISSIGLVADTPLLLLNREEGGPFDSPDFNDPTMNRGFIKISYWE